MAKKRKRLEPDGSANWLTTYADMITLVLCFFVLLYAFTTADIAESAESPTPPVPVAESLPNPQPEPLPPAAFESLYQKLSDYIAENGLSADIEIQRGAEYAFITFRNPILFDPDSYRLKPEGSAALDDLAEAMSAVQEEIAEVRILGHTSQADPIAANNAEADRFLSSNRATAVLVYLQEKNIIDPAKLISMGYGQFHPVSPFDTAENRSQNRRVEIMITKNSNVSTNSQAYLDGLLTH